MDQLAKDAVAATNRGMSYGQYIAKYKPPVPPAVRFPKKKAEPTRGQEKRPLCAICGQPIPLGSKNRKYCGAACSDIAISRQRVESQRRRKAAHAAAEE